MHQLYQFFRLIRFSNLLVIVLTMCFFYGLLSNYHLDRQYVLVDVAASVEFFKPTFFDLIGLRDINFILLIISLLLITASGYIINDYFDQKADRINKPKRVIIDKYIKRRWAIILNWTFNAIGFIISFYLSYHLNNWWIVLVSFISINLLYFYSAVYKRKLLTGNIIVAILTAFVPFYVFVFAGFSNFGSNSPFGSTDDIFITDNFIAIIVYCGFALLLNFIREIVKDMADVKGDLLLQSKTFPIRYGFKKTKYLLSGLYIITLSPLIYFVFNRLFTTTIANTNRQYLIYLLIMVIVFIIGSFIILITKSQSKHYNTASNAIKLAMLFGVISALFYN